MKRLSLTIDNGPEPAVTHAVLDVLKTRQLKATFFAIGRKLAAEGGLAAASRALAEGHRVGNHTYHHKVPLGRLTAAEAIAEIDRTEALLRPIGATSRLFRPYAGEGILHPALLHRAALAHLAAGGFTCVLWNSVPRDWIEPDLWVDRALADIDRQDWTVVVIHDIGSGAMAHLDRFLAAVEARGVAIVPELPDDCVPLRDGRAVFSVEHLTTG